MNGPVHGENAKVINWIIFPYVLPDSNRGFHIGDTCQDGCSSVIENSYCNSTTNTCLCLETHPINIDGVTCVQRKKVFGALPII